MHHSKRATTDADAARVKRVSGLVYPALAGSFGAQSVMFAKSAATAVRMSVSGDNQMQHFEVYLMILGLVTCVFLQLRYLNVSLVTAGA